MLGEGEIVELKELLGPLVEAGYDAADVEMQRIDTKGIFNISYQEFESIVQTFIEHDFCYREFERAYHETNDEDKGNAVDIENERSYSIQRTIEKQEIGVLYETFIFNKIQKTLINYNLNVRTYTWRTQDHAEVDVVLTGLKGVIPIEIKYKKKITRKDCSGLLSFMEDYPEVSQSYIVYPGEEMVKVHDKIIAVPDWWMLGSFG